MIDQKDVTIIVPHYGQSPESKYAWNQCAQSLIETVPEVVARDGGLIVATNGYDPAIDGVPNQVGDIHITSQGQCKAVNAAVAITNTPWILVTNDDMIYPPGWFEELVKPIGKKFFSSSEDLDERVIQPLNGGLPSNLPIGLREIPEILCISPKLIEPRTGSPTFEIYFCGGAGGDFDKNKFLEFAKNYKGQGIRTGSNLPFLIRRDLWETIGGYDINYDPWGSNSDSDLQYKIRLAGVQPYQNTNSIVYHFSQTSGTFNPQNQAFWNKNWEYFISKWGFPRTDQGIWEANFSIPDEGRKFRPDWEGKYGNVN